MPHPTITVPLSRLLNAAEPLQRLGRRPLPIKAAYHLTKLRRLVDSEIADFEAQRVALVKEFGDTRAATPEELAMGAGPEITTVSPAKMATFGARMNELIALEVSIPWAPFDLSALGAEGQVPSDDLLLLGAGEAWALADFVNDRESDAPATAKRLAEKSI